MNALYRLLALAAMPMLIFGGVEAQESHEQQPSPRTGEVINPTGPPLIFRLPSGVAPQRPAPEAMAMPARLGAPAGPVGPWYVEAMFGGLKSDDFFDATLRAHSTSMTGDKLIGAAIGREIYNFGYGFSAEVGLTFNHRIDEGGVEIALPIALVFDGFPWRDRLPMRLRVGFGPSFTTKVSDRERSEDKDGKGSKLLSMFNPEVEFGLPNAPEWSGFFRVHHRSGIFGTISGIDDGSTYFMIGLRHRFAIGDVDPLY